MQQTHIGFRRYDSTQIVDKMCKKEQDYFRWVGIQKKKARGAKNQKEGPKTAMAIVKVIDSI